MVKYYTVKYRSENTYENVVNEAFWQYLITPMDNETQQVVSNDFQLSISCNFYKSINIFDFNTIRLHCKKPFNNIVFEAVFEVVKRDEIQEIKGLSRKESFRLINSLAFKADFETWLTPTKLTTLPTDFFECYKFDSKKSIRENCSTLNTWVYEYLKFKTGVTTIKTVLKDVMEIKQGVCQDFSHVFCAIARKNKIPARYVSGYLHQGYSFFGDVQMHAWVEVFDPDLGWLGFDPTNNIRADNNHIKVAHGRDYSDCSPLKGVFYASGENKTVHSVQVTSQQ